MSWQCPAVSQAVSRAVPHAMSLAPWSRNKICIATQAPAARCRSCPNSHALCRKALLRLIAAPGALCRDARPSSYHDTNDFIVTHLNSKAARTRPPLASRASRSCRRSCRARGWLYHSPTAPPSKHRLDRIVPWRPCYVLIQYAVS